MALFGNLLKWQGGRKQQCEYFLKFAEELKSPLVVSMLVERSNEGISSTAAKQDFERFNVVRNMITLKYGKGQPVNHTLIVEVGGIWNVEVWCSSRGRA